MQKYRKPNPLGKVRITIQTSFDDGVEYEHGVTYPFYSTEYYREAQSHQNDIRDAIMLGLMDSINSTLPILDSYTLVDVVADILELQSEVLCDEPTSDLENALFLAAQAHCKHRESLKDK